MKRIIALSIFVAAAADADAQLVVANPTSDILSQVLHVEDIAKQVEIIQKQIEQINVLTSQLQQVQAYVKAFGDPEKLTTIVGADSLMNSLRTTGSGLTLDVLQKNASGADALNYNANGVFRSVGEKFTTPGGVEIPRAEEVYRKFAAIQQSSLNLQTVTADVFSRSDALRKQIATTTQRLEAATTDAETQKLTGILTGYNAELAAVDREIEHASAQLTAQDIENRADAEKQATARREERRSQVAEGFRKSSDAFRFDTTSPAFPKTP